jgi:hypothetical protein
MSEKDLAKQQSELYARRKLLILELDQIDTRLRAMNRPTHVNASEILAEMEKRERTRQKAKTHEPRPFNPNKVEGEFIGSLFG